MEQNLTPDTLLPNKIYYVFLNAINSGDKNYFSHEDSSTHPYFSDELEELSPNEFLRLLDFLDQNTEAHQLELAKARYRVAWEKSSWDQADLELHTHYQNILVRTDRYLHLQEEARRRFALKSLEFRLEESMRCTADTLGLSIQELAEFQEDFGNEALACLNWYTNTGQVASA